MAVFEENSINDFLYLAGKKLEEMYGPDFEKMETKETMAELIQNNYDKIFEAIEMQRILYYYAYRKHKAPEVWVADHACHFLTELQKAQHYFKLSELKLRFKLLDFDKKADKYVN